MKNKKIIASASLAKFFAISKRASQKDTSRPTVKSKGSFFINSLRFGYTPPLRKWHAKLCNLNQRLSKSTIGRLVSEGFIKAPQKEGLEECTQLLQRFETMEAIQNYVLDSSLHGAYFYANNLPGSFNDIYRLYCLRHHRSYFSSFTDYESEAPATNNCPVCKYEAKSAC